MILNKWPKCPTSSILVSDMSDPSEPIDPPSDLAMLIEALPDHWSENALHFACTAVGLSRERTPLEAAPQRTINQLYWSYELKDLTGQIEELARDAKLDVEFMVTGICQYVANQLAQFASHESSARAVENQKRALASIERDLATSFEDRDPPRSDKDLEKFAEVVRGFIDSAETRRADAELAWNRWEHETEQQFTSDYWLAFNEQRFRRKGNPPS
jgi:hypothetical protein